MKIIGLTGGIATGKSSVSRHLRALGIAVIDCDVLARRVVEPGRPALRALVKEFGEEILLPKESGRVTMVLDRAKLGQLIFQDPKKRARVNAITHPAIRREILAGIVDAWIRGEEMVVVDAPLLIESGLHRFMTEVVVVYWYLEIYLYFLLTRMIRLGGIFLPGWNLCNSECYPDTCILMVFF
jgi:dephospho-CoA kinase